MNRRLLNRGRGAHKSAIVRDDWSARVKKAILSRQLLPQLRERKRNPPVPFPLHRLRYARSACATNLGRISDFNLRAGALYNAAHANDLQISLVSFIPSSERETARTHASVRTHRCVA